MRSDEVIAVLLDHYGDRDPHQGGKWACFRELADRTGGGTRYCDLFVVGLWSSNARAIAIEVKVTRGDFQREIENPSKRAAWDDVATEFYFAVPAGLVATDEVPEGCGLFTIHRTENGYHTLRTAKKARQRKAQPWPFLFCQSLARRCSDPLPAFPADVQLELTSGTRIGPAQLRRLVDRLHGRAREQERGRGRLEPSHEFYLERERQRARAERIELGAMKRLLEGHFRTAITSVAQLRGLLDRTGELPPDPYLANRLRELADLLNPNPSPVPEVPHAS